jgi:aminoglycoside phosphotransferase (APT) family kinase protein
LLWGDVRLGNIIVGEDDGIAAVLDWEMASIGPAEVDLGWFFALQEMVTGGSGVELPGFLARDTAVARYEQRLGRAIGDLWWYELFALIRSTAVLIRMQRVAATQGRSDHWLAGIDPIPRRIRSFVQGL